MRIAGGKTSAVFPECDHVADAMRKYLPDKLENVSIQNILSLADVYAALTYYHDHQFEIEKSIRDGRKFAEELRWKTPSKIGGRMYDQKNQLLYG